MEKVRPDPVLTNLSVEYKNEDFIGDMVLPSVNSNLRRDTYYEFGRTNFIPVEDYRAPGAVASEVPGPTVTDHQFKCVSRAVRTKLTDEDLAEDDDQLQIEMGTTTNLTDQFLLAREIRIASMFTTAANYHADLQATVTTANKWGGNAATAESFLDQWLAAEQAIHIKCMKLPNSAIIPYLVLNATRKDDDAKDRIKYTQTGVLSEDLVKSLLNIENIYVPRAAKLDINFAVDSTTAGSGDLKSDGALEYVWGKDVIGFYNNPTPAKRSVSFAYEFNWNAAELPNNGAKPNRTVRRYYNELRALGIFRLILILILGSSLLILLTKHSRGTSLRVLLRRFS